MTKTDLQNSQNQEKKLERILKQEQIDENIIVPTFSKHLDPTLIEMAIAKPLPSSAMILLPELRQLYFLKTLIDSFAQNTKYMLVDNSNSKFDRFREQTNANLFYSTQSLNGLNYTNDVFDLIISSMSLTSTINTPLILPELKRVLKKGASFILACPISGTLPSFFNILTESLYKLNFPDPTTLIERINSSIEYTNLIKIIKQNNFNILEIEIIDMDITFAKVEDFLLSSIFENSYLPICLTITNNNTNEKKLLTQIVRSYHHYYYGIPFNAQLKMACMCIEK